MLDSAAWTIFFFCQALSKNQLRSLLRDQGYRRSLPSQLEREGPHNNLELERTSEKSPRSPRHRLKVSDLPVTDKVWGSPAELSTQLSEPDSFM